MKVQLSQSQVATMQLLSMVPVLSSTILSPIYPTMLRELGLTNSQLGTIASTGTLVALITSITIGIIDLKISRYSLMRLLLSFYVVGLAICASTSIFRNYAFFLLLVGRSLVGMGEIGGLQQVLACLGSGQEISNKNSIFGKVEGAASAGAASGPIIGSMLLMLAWWLGYVLPAVMMAAVIIFFTPNLKEIDYFKSTLAKTNDLEETTISRYVIMAGFSCMLLMFALSSMQTFVVGYFVKDKSISTSYAGVYVALHALCMAISAMLIGKRTNIKNASRNILIGLILFGVLLIAITKLSSILWLYFMAIVGGTGCGMILPSANVISSNFSNPFNIKKVSSLVYVMRISGSVMGPFIFGHLISFGYNVSFSTYGIILIVMSVALFLLSKDAYRNAYQ